MSSDPIRIGIIEPSLPPGQLHLTFGAFTPMIQRWLQPLNALYDTYPLYDGVIPCTPTQADLWILTGSPLAVYEALPWRAPLEAFIRECRRCASALLGICFGHQFIAQTFGAQVAPSRVGWGGGVQRYAVQNWPAQWGAMGDSLALLASHHDQVVSAPASAQVVAQSDFCPFAGLWYPDFALTLQGHPEFTPEFARALLKSRAQQLDPPRVQRALQSFAEPHQGAHVAQAVRYRLASTQDVSLFEVKLA